MSARPPSGGPYRIPASPPAPPSFGGNPIVAGELVSLPATPALVRGFTGFLSRVPSDILANAIVGFEAGVTGAHVAPPINTPRGRVWFALGKAAGAVFRRGAPFVR